MGMSTTGDPLMHAFRAGKNNVSLDEGGLTMARRALSLSALILVVVLAASSVEYAQDLAPVTLPAPKTEGGRP